VLDTEPKVSVIIPHYNMHSTLPEAVKSVADQAYKNIELIVVDDGSHAGIRSSCFSAFEPKLKVLKIDQNKGKPSAVNRGFEAATGDYFTILDADDQLPRYSISKRISALQSDQVDLCIGSFEICYQQAVQSVRSIAQYAGRSRQYLKRHLLTAVISPFHQNAMLFSKTLLQRTGPMDPKMIRGQDKDFAIRLIQNSSGIAYVDEPVYRYNRYDRPLKKRIRTRLIGMRYKLEIVGRYAASWRKGGYLLWGTVVEAAKLVHDLFGSYKK
jgi:glycosyltransferase involved in cell wall biosynthesis